jgi:hypothetical protein
VITATIVSVETSRNERSDRLVGAELISPHIFVPCRGSALGSSRLICQQGDFGREWRVSYPKVVFSATALKQGKPLAWAIQRLEPRISKDRDCLVEQNYACKVFARSSDFYETC